jgi:hypothetical protein
MRRPTIALLGLWLLASPVAVADSGYLAELTERARQLRLAERHRVEKSRAPLVHFACAGRPQPERFARCTGRLLRLILRTVQCRFRCTLF